MGVICSRRGASNLGEVVLGLLRGGFRDRGFMAGGGFGERSNLGEVASILNSPLMGVISVPSLSPSLRVESPVETLPDPSLIPSVEVIKLPFICSIFAVVFGICGLSYLLKDQPLLVLVLSCGLIYAMDRLYSSWVEWSLNLESFKQSGKLSIQTQEEEE